MTHNIVNAGAAVRDYNITPRVDYRTVLDVEGPLVILDNVKFPREVALLILSRCTTPPNGVTKYTS